MSTRKIKDAVDHGTKELIYFKGHAKATYMSDGSTVEDTINNIESKIDLSDYVTTDELEGYAKIEAIPSLEGYAKKSDLPNFDEFAKSEDIPSVTDKQDKLISGTNIKTINNQSILGSGNITIGGGSSVTVDTSMSSTSTNPVQNKVVKNYIDSNCNIPVETTTSTSKQLTPNKYCKWANTPTSITITLATPTNSNILNNYMFEFTASSSGTTLTMPSTIKWLNGSTPTIDNGKTYQISIINNLATISKFG